MKSDPTVRLGQQRNIADAWDIDSQLSAMRGCRPIVSMLVKAKNEAAEALSALAFADPNDPKVIMELQNCVKRFDDLVRWVREMIADGSLARSIVDETDEQEMSDFIHDGPPDVREEADELGLKTGDTHDA